MKKPLVLGLLFCLAFCSCSSSESPVVKAEIEISPENPAVITFDEARQMWDFKNCLNFTEVNGVSGELEAIIFEVIGYGDVLFKKIYERREFRGFESWKICWEMFHKDVMKSIQVTILGADDLGNRIDYSQVFFLTR